MFTKYGIGCALRMRLRLSFSDARLNNAITASTLACGVPEFKVSTRKGIAPDAPMVDLFTGDADSVANKAVACSSMFKLSNWKKVTIGSNAPASTILILFL
ncbi:hypothetical protein Hanom_Chr11g00972991 [Helianthus anomalus]